MCGGTDAIVSDVCMSVVCGYDGSPVRGEVSDADGVRGGHNSVRVRISGTIRGVLVVCYVVMVYVNVVVLSKDV